VGKVKGGELKKITIVAHVYEKRRLPMRWVCMTVCERWRQWIVTLHHVRMWARKLEVNCNSFISATSIVCPKNKRLESRT